jgi:hypothetical protein
MFLNGILSSVGAFTIHMVIDEAFKLDSERKLIEIIEDSIDGLVVFDQKLEQVFCTQKARLIF